MREVKQFPVAASPAVIRNAPPCDPIPRTRACDVNLTAASKHITAFLYPGAESELLAAVAHDLQAREVNAVILVKLHILLGEIFADHAYQFHRPKETRRHCRVARRAAEQLRVFLRGSFNGIQSRRTDNQYAHSSVVNQVVNRAEQ